MLRHTAVIFAGGRSSRMNQDKALLPFGKHTTLAEYQYRRLLPWFASVYLSTKEDKFPFAAPLIYDTHPIHSPLVALQSVLTHVACEAVFVLSVDMPGVDRTIIDRLYAQFVTQKPLACVARSKQGCEPLCGIYHRKALPEINAMIQNDDHRLRTLLRQLKATEVECQRSGIFVNLNTPDDYRPYAPSDK